MFALVLFTFILRSVVISDASLVAQHVGNVSYDSLPPVLPGTQPLESELSPQEMSRRMLEGAHRFVDRKIAESRDARKVAWSPDFSSRRAYEHSVSENRKRFMNIIGVSDRSTVHKSTPGTGSGSPPVVMLKTSMVGDDEKVAETEKYNVYQVRWPATDGIYAEGLLINPVGKTVGCVVALPDADQTPEQLIGLEPGIDPESQFARRLAENGYQVLIPVLISRRPMFPGEQKEQTNREWLYRQSFHMGKHIIGYEVEKVIAAIDWFKFSSPQLKVGVAGYCEGGLIAMYAAAVDTRIDAVMVSGYFTSRENVWNEPIYRNVWSLLKEFGDAEIVSLIAPRPVVLEYSKVDRKLEEATRKPSPIDEYAYSGYKGSIRTPPYQEVESEFRRIGTLLKDDFQVRHLVAGRGKAPLGFGSPSAIEKFTSSLGSDGPLPLSSSHPVDRRSGFEPASRQLSQVREIEEEVQRLVRDSDQERYAFFLHKVMPEWGERRWSTKRYHPYFLPDSFVVEAADYRKYFAEEVLGRFDDRLLPPNARTKKVYDRALWTGYEVVLDVYPELIAPGVLLIPKDIQPGEKRPVVVCQHGRNGVPQILVEGNTSYYDMAAKLADQGFIVYAPYGMFSGEDRYRWLSRKANTIGKSLFSFLLAQHDQLLKWLGSQPFVDSKRIAFYGKSYGGETAMRVPSVLEGYCLSICSADFGDWTRKVADTHFSKSFMHTIEWEMPYFNMGRTFSYAEMAYQIFPRPFMVERGRHDLVQPDEFVAYEYAKVSFLYDQFNMLDKTEIEFFNGGHASRNDGTFEFLHKHLNWP